MDLVDLESDPIASEAEPPSVGVSVYPAAGETAKTKEKVVEYFLKWNSHVLR